MPTYAYACSACEHAFDIHQSFSDAPLTTCPQCERETLRKLFSPVGVVFKGSGFYRTDSRASAKAKSGSSSGQSSSGSSSSGKSEGKGSSSASGSSGGKSEGSSPSSSGSTKTGTSTPVAS